jgi:hypothetical protein
VNLEADVVCRATNALCFEANGRFRKEDDLCAPPSVVCDEANVVGVAKNDVCDEPDVVRVATDDLWRDEDVVSLASSVVGVERDVVCPDASRG